MNNMLEQDFKEFVAYNKFVGLKQPYNDDFLQVMQTFFTWSSIIGVLFKRTRISYVWTACILCSLLCIEGMAIWKVIKALTGLAIDTAGHRSVAARFAGTLFYSISLTSLILASRLSLSWRNLAEVWTKAECAMALNIPQDTILRRRLYAIGGSMLCFALIEHIMSITSHIGLDCPPELILKQYVLQSHGFMILRHEYSEWIAIPLLFISTVASLLWNMQDLIIILISIGLTSRYQRLNKFLYQTCALEKQHREHDKNIKSLLRIHQYTWRRLREAYVKQALLVRRMDLALGGIVVLSCLCNFYFICLQLFLGITQGVSDTQIKKAYFAVSLCWLITRVISVVLSASCINTQSQQALKYIYTHDTHGYNIEVVRLQDQLTKDYIALSGMGFFYLNKTILLKVTPVSIQYLKLYYFQILDRIRRYLVKVHDKAMMFGAIITYELMMIQFDNKGPDHTNTNSTTIS